MAHRSLFIALAFLLAACSSAGHAERPSVEAPAVPPVSSPAPEAAVELVQVSRMPRDEAPALGQANKPNGWQYRYRRHVPAQIPAYVPRELDSLSLVLSEPTEDGWLALYEGPFQEIGPNRAYRAILFDAQGERVWDLNLNRFFSRATHLEVADIRYSDGALYFNEACQTYSSEAGGSCSSLVRLDPLAEQVAWRTRPLTSNDIFLLHGPYITAGYGFTSEEDFLYLIDRETGEILSRAPLDSAHDYLQIEEDAVWVVTYRSAYLFRIQKRDALYNPLRASQAVPYR